MTQDLGDTRQFQDIRFANLIKLKTLINHKFKSQYILCYNLLVIFFFIYTKNV